MYKLSTLKERERLVILARLSHYNGNKTHTAKSLGIGLRTLQRKLNTYGVSQGQPGRPLKETKESTL